MVDDNTEVGYHRRDSDGLYLRGSLWWLTISIGGRRFRGSTGIRGGRRGQPPKEALAYRANKLAEFGRGNMTALSAEKLTISSVLQLLVDRYKAEARASSLLNLQIRTRFLLSWYGGWRAIHFTPDIARAYALKRREMKAAIATVNAELRYLKLAFAEGASSGRIGTVPRIKMLPGAHKRFGVIAESDLVRIMARLRPDLQAVVRFLRLTGWRLGEALALEWCRIDWESQQIRLDTSKTGRPRAVPWTTYPALESLLRAQRQVAEDLRARGILASRVFPNANGKALTNAAVGGGWCRACDAAKIHGAPRHDGTPGRPLIHDLRRTLSTEMDRKGVSWGVQKVVTGHQDDRQHADYIIATRSDVEDGLKKLTETETEECVVNFRRND